MGPTQVYIALFRTITGPYLNKDFLFVSSLADEATSGKLKIIIENCPDG